MHASFVTFEGIDGCGKSTQVRLLSERLTTRRVEHVATRQPGGTTAGAAIRRMLLEPRDPPLAADAKLLLWAADRAQHVHEIVKPALAAGLPVLCDRYTDSTVAYQGRGRGLDVDLITRLNALATGGLVPDLTILLDLDPVAAAARLRQRSAGPADRFDFEQQSFHERVRAGFLDLARADPDRFLRVLDAAEAPDALAGQIERIVLDRLARDASTP